MDEELKNLLEWLRNRLDDGEYATAEAFLTDVFGKAGRYDDDISVRDAKIEQITGERDTALADVKNLKARNYDLLMQIPSDGENQGDGTVIESVDDDGEVTHIDNLFVDADENGNPVKEG